VGAVAVGKGAAGGGDDGWQATRAAPASRRTRVT